MEMKIVTNEAHNLFFAVLLRRLNVSCSISLLHVPKFALKEDTTLCCFHSVKTYVVGYKQGTYDKSEWTYD